MTFPPLRPSYPPPVPSPCVPFPFFSSLDQIDFACLAATPRPFFCLAARLLAHLSNSSLHFQVTEAHFTSSFRPPAPLPRANAAISKFKTKQCGPGMAVTIEAEHAKSGGNRRRWGRNVNRTKKTTTETRREALKWLTRRRGELEASEQECRGRRVQNN
jgi:hypothetical protein